MLAALCMAASLFHALRDEWRKRAARILLHEDGGIGVEGHAVFHGAMWAPRAVDLDWAVWLQLTVVYARPAFFRRRWLMLLPGNMTPRQWRVLRIWLRHKAAKARAEESG